jgi:hypothetical protein
MSIQSFITNFRGGTRKNRFRVKCNIPGFTIPPPPTGEPADFTPTAVQSAESGAISSLGGFDDFHVLAASLPTSIITTNPIDYRGRRILYPGDRIYSGDGFNVWTVTIQDDISNIPTGSTPSAITRRRNLWSRLHAWCNGINSHRYNVGNTTIASESDIIVEQLNLNDTGVPLKKATLKNAWPQSITPIDMEMQARDQYNTFDVTFCFKYVEYE